MTRPFPDRFMTILSKAKIGILALGFACAVAAAGCSNTGAGGMNAGNPSPSVSATLPGATPSQNKEDDSMEDWKLIWSDEFDGPDGSLPDPGKWVMEKGNNRGWGNSELEYYTDSPDNCSVSGGNLVIKAVGEEKEGFHYTSARLKTAGKFEFRYGKVEMRARLPYGKGIWPAFWMLGSNIETVGWPQCGEIDIMEFIGRTPGKVYGTLHGPEYSGSMGIGRNTTCDGDLANDFHTYTLEWDENSLKWFFDGQRFHQVIKEKLPTSYTWVYDQNFFILLNLAVGGNWPQSPDSSTEFPQSYIIDYVRVYQK